MSPRQTRVIVTRVAATSSAFCDALERAGVRVLPLPLLETLPVSDEGLKRNIQTEILDFDHYNAAMFVSMNAVHEAMNWLDKYWPQLPIGIRYYAVGTTTARVLESYHLTVEELSQIDDGAMNSEALLATASVQNVANERWIIFRGVGGRNLFAETLRDRGAHVTVCELYERSCPAVAEQQLCALISDSQAWNQHYNVIAIHSGESLQNLINLINGLSNQEHQTQLLQTAILVPSERIAEIAQDNGFSQIIRAKNATDTAMLEALKR